MIFYNEYGEIELPDWVDETTFDYQEFRKHIEYFIGIGASFSLNNGELHRLKTINK